MNKAYRVTVVRTSYASAEIEVTIESTGNAERDNALVRRKALEKAGDHEFGSGEADYTVEGFTRIPDI